MKVDLEKALKEFNEKATMFMDEKLEAEERLRAANDNISRIQRALDKKEQQLLLNVQLARSEINEYKSM